MLSDQAILFEDNHVLVVNKPAGLTTKTEQPHMPSLEDACKLYIKEKAHKSGNVYLHAIHRIDRPVSGIVVLAKTSKALSRLSASIRERRCTKTYVALLEGRLSKQSGSLEHHLLQLEHIAIVAANDPRAKLCLLHYDILKEFPQQSLAKIQLITGRYHQIRAQFSATGHPIVGDLKYGSQRVFSRDAIALHHYQMTITHPVTKELLLLKAPFPEYWPKEIIEEPGY